MLTTKAKQRLEPVEVLFSRDRHWWTFEDLFYWTSESLTPRDVLALIRDRERKAERKLEWAHTLLDADHNRQPHRQPITREMRRAVYERDGGRCVECGSTFDLQYDHIIPVALGGATTLENLQLLCSRCNQEKSDSL